MNSTKHNEVTDNVRRVRRALPPIPAIGPRISEIDCVGHSVVVVVQVSLVLVTLSLSK